MSLPDGEVFTNLEAMKSQKWTVGLLCVITLMTGCVNVGTNYKFDKVSALKLGELESRDYVALFGKPRSTRTLTTKEGKYEFATYSFAQAGMDKGRFRLLNLEFKDGKLNAYDFLSCFEEDQTRVDNSKIDAIRAGINKLTREDVKSLAGKPHGQAKCPTKLGDFKPYCDKANEVWVWMAAEQLNLFGRDKDKFKIYGAAVLFGDDGKVSDVQTEEVAGLISDP